VKRSFIFISETQQVKLKQEEELKELRKLKELKTNVLRVYLAVELKKLRM